MSATASSTPTGRQSPRDGSCEHLPSAHVAATLLPPARGFRDYRSPSSVAAATPGATDETQSLNGQPRSRVERLRKWLSN